MKQTECTATNWSDDAREYLERYLEHVDEVLRLRGYNPKETVDSMRAQVTAALNAGPDRLVQWSNVRDELEKLDLPPGIDRSKRLAELDDIQPAAWLHRDDGLREPRFPPSVIWAISGIAFLVFFVLPIVILVMFREGNVQAESSRPVTGRRTAATNPSAPFKNSDPAMVGTWISVDFVNAIEDFQPGVKSWPGAFHLKSVHCDPNGHSTMVGYGFSNGIATELNSGVRAPYFIKNLHGEDYLFLPWLSGDVVYRGLPPKYYVLKKST